MYIPIWVIVIVSVIIFYVYKSKKKNTDTDLLNQPTNIETIEKDTDTLKQDTVIKIQKDFEEKLEQTYLPDSIGDREIYIYKNLMLPWYVELSSKNHYNEKITQKIRKDWVDYMVAREKYATCGYLSCETDEQEKVNSYVDRGRTASKKAAEIENAFASSIGKEAIDELFSIRNIAEEKFPQMIMKQTLKKTSAQRKNNK